MKFYRPLRLCQFIDQRFLQNSTDCQGHPPGPPDDSGAAKHQQDIEPLVGATVSSNQVFSDKTDPEAAKKAEQVGPDIGTLSGCTEQCQQTECCRHR